MSAGTAGPQKPAAPPAPLGDGSGNRYFVCCDGTSNEPTGKSLNDTNPYRLAQICAPKHGAIFQVVGYQQGIGTIDGKASDHSALTALENIWGQGLGDGLDYNSFKVCQWLASKGCTASADVVLCGFSRGSFTQRIVAQYINDVGLLDMYQGEPTEEYTQRLWATYYNWFLSKAGSAFPPHDLERARDGLAKAEAAVPKHNYAPPFKPRSLSLALFDTVGTAGLPGEIGKEVAVLNDEIEALQNRWKWLPEQLPPAVTWARHAVSLGEKRALFSVTMMRAASECDLAQRWFPGVHTAVGGGGITLENNVASFDPFAWMIGELQDAGKMLFDTNKLQQMVSLIANQETISKVNIFPGSTGGFWAAMGTAKREPGKSSNEYVQTAIDPFQKRMAKAGAQIQSDVKIPSSVKPGSNGQWHSYILSLGQKSTGVTVSAQITAIPKTSWIPAASTQFYIKEYYELTGIDNVGFEGFDSTSHPLPGAAGAASGPTPKFPAPGPQRTTN